MDGFEQLAQQTETARRDTVITHGEPHPANLISVGNELLLVDWDTIGLAPRERDLSLIVDEPGSSVERYQRVTGHRVDFEVITLYRLRWYLDDLASAVRLFRRPHDENRIRSAGGRESHPESRSSPVGWLVWPIRRRPIRSDGPVRRSAARRRANPCRTDSR